MITLANTDDTNANNQTVNGYRHQSARLQEARTQRLDDLEKDASGVNDIPAPASE